MAGIARPHAMIGELLGEDNEATVLVIGIETQAGPWVQRSSGPATRTTRSTRCWWHATGSVTALSGAERDTGDAHGLGARHLRRLRHALRNLFPAAVVAFHDLTAVDALERLT